MNRCESLPQSLCTRRKTLSALSAAALGLTLASASLLCAAQSGGRDFPRNALRGVLLITAPPEVLLDGRPERLSPGSRIRDPQNGLVMSGTLVGQRLLVNFTRESNGLIHEVWLLSPQEAQQKRALATPERNFIFSSEADAPARDDGKTPFDKLPKYPQQ